MLGQDFHTEVRRAEALIADRPATWPRWPRVGVDVRRFKLARFPYCLAFQVTGDDIAMIAVAHQSRAPFLLAVQGEVVAIPDEILAALPAIPSTTPSSRQRWRCKPSGGPSGEVVS